MTICECNFFLCIHAIMYIFIMEIVRVLLDLTNKHLYIGGLRVCCEYMWFLVFSERCAPPGK